MRYQLNVMLENGERLNFTFVDKGKSYINNLAAEIGRAAVNGKVVQICADESGFVPTAYLFPSNALCWAFTYNDESGNGFRPVQSGPGVAVA